GAYTDSTSRQLSFADPDDAKAGTLLYQLGIDDAVTGDYKNAWYYSAPINVNQGELVGSKRIFKYVVVAGRDPSSDMIDPADDFFNLYQVAVSSTNLGAPTEVANVRVFAYSLSISLEGTVASGSE